jgi:hypothetical protein
MLKMFLSVLMTVLDRELQSGGESVRTGAQNVRVAR